MEDFNGEVRSTDCVCALGACLLPLAAGAARPAVLPLRLLGRGQRCPRGATARALRLTPGAGLQAIIKFIGLHLQPGKAQGVSKHLLHPADASGIDNVVCVHVTQASRPGRAAQRSLPCPLRVACCDSDWTAARCTPARAGSSQLHAQGCHVCAGGAGGEAQGRTHCHLCRGQRQAAVCHWHPGDRAGGALQPGLHAGGRHCLPGCGLLRRLPDRLQVRLVQRTDTA